jgi:hypothetical protein
MSKKKKRQPKMDMYEVISEIIEPEIMQKFLAKGKDYEDSWRLLGAKGQFSDINRKFWKLYRAIWRDQPLIGEPVDECVEDIIGHCLILLYILREPDPPNEVSDSSHESGVPPTLPVEESTGVPEGEYDPETGVLRRRIR